MTIRGDRRPLSGARRRALPRQRRHGVSSADGGAGDGGRRLPSDRRAANARAADRRSRRRAARARLRDPLRGRRPDSRRSRSAAPGGAAGGTVRIRGDVSSQFLSALLMAMPLARGAADRAATTVRVTTPLISRPYVEITTSLMRRFGVAVDMPDAATFRVSGRRALSKSGNASPSRAMRRRRRTSSPRASSAAGRCGSTGVGRESIQGDVAFADVLGAQGADVRFGPTGSRPRRRTPLAGGTIDCDRDSRRRDDARGHRASRRAADAAYRHRQLARQGDRPHRGDGDGACASSAHASRPAPTGSSSIRCRRHVPADDRHLRRSSDGDVLRAGRRCWACR